ncbi:hypothetical protein [Fluviicola taffensis]|jgi:hypothetical protein|uniref:Outer membrane protein beta-barrel domain-containing protein n=1 Tax=Fluviicola taffensis (strain DSM 16823 / NCIMB 13979 / RW262) TaxID=755732 RepID=F2IDG0_FLUTR|nr:hypothetical protein [Fluviicola taffensis]AEA42336.1 hypothetical protein Fluta_0327 [Fluviicola taffensis DSM 16823]
MKKFAFGLVGCLFLASVANAQDEPIKNKKGQVILPEAGDFGLGFNAVPVLTYIGNAFNGNLDNTSMGQNKFASMFGQNVIFGKYFLSPKNAIRIDFRFGLHSRTFKSDVFNDLANSPDSLVVDKAKLLNQNYTLGAGYEWRLGKGRLQGVVGGSVFYTFASSTRGKYEYGNAYADGLAAPTSTTWDNFGNILGSAPTGERITKMKGGNTWGVGARVFAGVEYFVAPKISIGAEFGWSLGYSQTGSSKNSFESWDAVNSVLSTRERSVSGNSRFDVDTDNFGGALYLMFHFR